MELQQEFTAQEHSKKSIANLTALLDAWRAGDDDALEKALPQLYQQLRRLARRYLSREYAEHSYETRDLVHEAFLRLQDQRHVPWQSRSQFLAVAGRMMRRILIDHARRKKVRGGRNNHVELDETVLVSAVRGKDLLALDEALRALAETDSELAQIVELRFFAGLKHREVALLIGKSEPTVRRRFRVAKAWLYRCLQEKGGKAAGVSPHG